MFERNDSVDKMQIMSDSARAKSRVRPLGLKLGGNHRRQAVLKRTVIKIDNWKGPLSWYWLFKLYTKLDTSDFQKVGWDFDWDIWQCDMIWKKGRVFIQSVRLFFTKRKSYGWNTSDLWDHKFEGRGPLSWCLKKLSYF